MTCIIKPYHKGKPIQDYALRIPEMKNKEVIISYIAGVIRLREAGLDDKHTKRVSSNGLVSLPRMFAEFVGSYELEEEQDWYVLVPQGEGVS